MITRLIQCKLFFLILLVLLFLTGCDKPTYPKETIEESVTNLCKKEYKLDVKVKIIGSTLGVYIPIDGLIDPDLKLNKDAGEKIENTALSIHRVTTSTDRPLKFYVLTARDTKILGGEFVLIGFIYDVVRVRLFDISRDEYFKRILRDFRFNPAVSGEARIRELISALNQNLPSVAMLKPIFYPIYTIGKTFSQRIEVDDITSKEISDHESLLYVITSEYYEPGPGFEVYTAIFPPGFKNSYLFLIDLSSFPNPIKEIITKYFYASNEIRQRNLKDTFDQYKDNSYIGADGLPKKDLELTWFLGQQISRRIKMIFEENPKLKKAYKAEAGSSDINNKIFQFKFDISAVKPSPKDNEIIFSNIIKMTANTFHRYSFEDFEGVEFINTQADGKIIYLSKDELKKFRKNKIKIQDLCNSSALIRI